MYQNHDIEERSLSKMVQASIKPESNVSWQQRWASGGLGDVAFGIMLWNCDWMEKALNCNG